MILERLWHYYRRSCEFEDLQISLMLAKDENRYRHEMHDILTKTLVNERLHFNEIEKRNQVLKLRIEALEKMVDMLLEEKKAQ